MTKHIHHGWSKPMPSSGTTSPPTVYKERSQSYNPHWSRVLLQPIAQPEANKRHRPPQRIADDKQEGK
jgi:hypothetical protein